MHDVECILLSKEIVQDEIGVEKEITKEREKQNNL